MHSNYILLTYVRLIDDSASVCSMIESTMSVGRVESVFIEMRYRLFCQDTNWSLEWYIEADTDILRAWLSIFPEKVAVAGSRINSLTA